MNSTIARTLHQMICALGERPHSAPLYGMVIHEACLDPRQRVEYLADNRDFLPLTMDLQQHKCHLGSWSAWSWLRRNRPVMCHWDGTVAYAINPTDYRLQADNNLPSHIDDPAYPGQAMAEIPLLYSLSYRLGSDRYVFFSEQRLHPAFHAVGFLVLGKLRQSMLIPMFYGSLDPCGRMRSLAGQWSAGTTSGTARQNQFAQDMDVYAQADAIRCASPQSLFFGGALVNVLVDLAVLLARSTDSQGSYGTGVCCGATNDEDISGHWGTLPNPILSQQFYGGNDGRTFTNLFHSTVLGSNMLWQRDPYLLSLHGRLCISEDYHLDLTGLTYQDTGIVLDASGAFASTAVIPTFGAVPTSQLAGTTQSGYCGQIYASSQVEAACARFGCCRSGNGAGFFAKSMNHSMKNGGRNRDGLPVTQSRKIDPTFSWWWNFGCSLMLPGTPLTKSKEVDAHGENFA